MYLQNINLHGCHMVKQSQTHTSKNSKQHHVWGRFRISILWRFISAYFSHMCVFFGGKTGLWVGSWIKTIGGETSNIFWMVSIIFYTPNYPGEMIPNLTSHIFQMAWFNHQLDVSENSGTPKSSIVIGFSIINHPFWGTPIFGNPHLDAPCDGNMYPALFPCWMWPLVNP